MSVGCERLAGDTSEFALRIGFSPDPDAGQGIDPEVGISWGSFQIWIEGRNLCAHNEDGSRVDSVHWFLLPLMEWLVRNWNPLLHEERFPVPNEHDTGWESLRATRFPPPAIENDDERAAAWERKWQSWWTRHALCSAREGGLFPDVILRRLRDSIEISWGPARSAGMPDHFSFLESVPGVSLLEPSKVADPLHQVLSDAGGYLLSLAPESPRIKALVGSLQELNSEEPDRRLMWLAGQGTDEETVRTGWDRAKTVLSELGDAANSVLSSSAPSPLVIAGSCQAALMFELCHVLLDRRIGHHLALASGPWAPPGIEQRANAFAAMLLMPPLLVQRVISRLAVPIDTAAGVREAARTLRAGVRSVLSHLKNAGFITGIEHERIANEMFSRFDPR